MRAALIILAIVVVFLQYRLWFGTDGIAHVFHLKREIKEQKAKNGEIIKRNAALANEINALKKGGVAIENRARNELGMVKKGEVFYQVVK